MKNRGEVSGTVSAFSLSGYGIGVEEFENSKIFSAYPNPATYVINFNVAGDYMLYDVTGKPLKKVYNASEMSVSELPVGVYLLENEDGEVLKITKQ